MARQSSRSSASSASKKDSKQDEPVEVSDELTDEEVDEVEDVDDDADDVEEDKGAERSALADAMWSDVKIEPIELALPKGVGYTLRAYRMSNELTPTQVAEDEDDDFAVLRRREDEVDEEEVVILENPEMFEEEPEPEPERAKKKTSAAAKKKDDKSDDESDEETASATDDEADESSAAAKDDDKDDTESDESDETSDEPSDEDESEDEAEEEEEEEEPEEVPVFLSHEGKLLLFRSVEGLVEFVQSDAEHDMVQLDTWESLKKRITVSSVVATDENRYELDLVVENLRGGQDAWDADLLLAAGEAARDLAYGLRLEPVRTALSTGSPLDDLDEGLRAAASGGIGGFFAKRRLKKIGAQQAALGWRTIIGKISAAADWRD